MNRRSFLRAVRLPALAGIAHSRYRAAGSEQESPSSSDKPQPLAKRICLFTDHLDDFGYSYDDIARMLKQLDIAGPDLTVRPGGLVLPERVVEDLPKAVAAFRDAGLAVPMISTGLTSAKDRMAADTLTTAGKLGIRYFKLGYYGYDDPAQWRAQLDTTRKELDAAACNEQAGWHGRRIS